MKTAWKTLTPSSWIRAVGETTASVDRHTEEDGVVHYIASAYARIGGMCFWACTSRYKARQYYKALEGARRAAMRLAQTLEPLRR